MIHSTYFVLALARHLVRHWVTIAPSLKWLIAKRAKTIDKIRDMSTADTQIHKFWKWFTAHLSDFSHLSKPSQPFWDTALAEIKKIDDRLWFELSCTPDGVREFVFTAEGHVDAFPIAERLIALAPELEGWIFVALKPPIGFSFTTEYEGIFFDPGGMWFLPLQSIGSPHELGLQVGIRGLELIDTTTACNALLVILDTALGERSAALDIQHIKVCELPDNPESLGYIELPELPAYIAWRQKNLSSQ